MLEIVRATGDCKKSQIAPYNAIIIIIITVRHTQMISLSNIDIVFHPSFGKD